MPVFTAAGCNRYTTITAGSFLFYRFFSREEIINKKDYIFEGIGKKMSK